MLHLETRNEKLKSGGLFSVVQQIESHYDNSFHKPTTWNRVNKQNYKIWKMDPPPVPFILTSINR